MSPLAVLLAVKLLTVLLALASVVPPTELVVSRPPLIVPLVVSAIVPLAVRLTAHR